MGVLSDREIRDLVDEGVIQCEEDLNVDLQLGSSSFDLRLGREFKVLDTRKLDLIDTRDMEDYSEYASEEIHGSDEGVIVHPGEFILGSTLETVDLPDDLVARVEGRSSYGRLGIIVHATAGFIDPGFKGDITLEIQNLGNVPVKLYPGDRICQIVFEGLKSSSERPYDEKTDSKYMEQEGVTASRLGEEKR